MKDITIVVSNIHSLRHLRLVISDIWLTWWYSNEFLKPCDTAQNTLWVALFKKYMSDNLKYLCIINADEIMSDFLISSVISDLKFYCSLQSINEYHSSVYHITAIVWVRLTSIQPEIWFKTENRYILHT